MVLRTGVRAYGRTVVWMDTSDVITKPKFLALMGLPKSLSYGAPLARALRRARELRYYYDDDDVEYECYSNNVFKVYTPLITGYFLCSQNSQDQRGVGNQSNHHSVFMDGFQNNKMDNPGYTFTQVDMPKKPKKVCH